MLSVEIKNKTTNFIENGQIKDLFVLIDQLEFTDWLNLLFKKVKREFVLSKKLAFQNAFWQTLPLSKHFSQLAVHRAAVKLLETYFKSPFNVNETFNREFIKYNSPLFIKSIKYSRKFFDFRYIQATNHLQVSEDKEIASHAKFWRYLYNSERERWNAFEQDIQLWSKLNPIEVLAYSCYFLENKKELLDFTFLNTLFSLYFFEKRSSNISKEIETIDADSLITEILFKCIANPNNVYFRSLSKLESWFFFVENAVNTYAYSDNSYLSETDYYFHLNCEDNVVEAKWRLNGKKIELLPLAVEFNNKVNAELLLKARNIQTIGKNEKERTVNAALDISIQSLNFLLDSMQFTGYQVEETFVPIFPISLVLNGFIKNANERYLKSLMEFKENSSTTSPLEAVIGSGLLQESRQEAASLPLRTDTLKEFKKIIGDHTKYIDSSIKILCFNPETTSYSDKFNRFNPFVKIEAQPFFQIGTYFLSFNNVIGGLHNSFKTLSLNTEFHRKNKLKSATECFRPQLLISQEITNFESNVKKQFAEKGEFDRLLASVEIHNLGEIDLLVFHQQTLMLVELKRPYFKTSLKQTANEAIEAHQKGAIQLNRLVEYFKNSKNKESINKQFGINQTDIKIILPIVISTSLEQDGEMIDGILKQNFFQFNFHVQHMDWHIKSPLEQLYQNLKADEFWKKLTTLYQEYAQPLPGYDSRLSFLKNSQGIIEDKENEYYYYDLGNEFYHQKDFNNALVNFEKARQLNPEEAEYIGSVANCLAEMRQFQMAIIAFEEALSKRNDSFIRNNFLVTLNDALTE